MGRKEDLEKHIRENYSFLLQYERMRMVEDDPLTRRRYEMEIEKEKEEIKNWGNQYFTLRRNRPFSIPQDISETLRAVGLSDPALFEVRRPIWVIAAPIVVLVISSGIVVGLVLQPTPTLTSTPTPPSSSTSTHTLTPPPIQTSAPSSTLPEPTLTASPTTVIELARELQVSKKLTTDICVDSGTTMSIEASGFIIVGPRIGQVTSDGTERGFLGLPLGDDFDLVKPFAHGALLCKIEGESDWRKCGSSYTFIAPIDGCLEFEINDNDQPNNTGAFTVTIRDGVTP